LSGFDRFNPCKGDSLDTPVIRHWARLNAFLLRGVDCVCCGFYRGLAAGAVLAWVAGMIA